MYSGLSKAIHLAHDEAQQAARVAAGAVTAAGSLAFSRSTTSVTCRLQRYAHTAARDVEQGEHEAVVLVGLVWLSWITGRNQRHAPCTYSAAHHNKRSLSVFAVRYTFLCLAPVHRQQCLDTFAKPCALPQEPA
jgi:hypothetical protein